MLLDINSARISKKLEKLDREGKFIKYSNMFKRNNCLVRVNNDDYLEEDEFIITSPKGSLLPKQIYVYGRRNAEDIISLNQWLEIFLKTIEKGYIEPHEIEKSNLKYELAIGIPYEFRRKAYNYDSWGRDNIVEFLSCLFDTKLEEINYQQQDMFELMAA